MVGSCVGGGKWPSTGPSHGNIRQCAGKMVWSTSGSRQSEAQYMAVSGGFQRVGGLAHPQPSVACPLPHAVWVIGEGCVQG